MVARCFGDGVRPDPGMLWLEEGGRDRSLGTGGPWPGSSLTLILSAEDEDSVAGEDLELVVLGGASHLNHRERDHPLGVGFLE